VVEEMEAMFQDQDVDKSGDLDATELGVLLQHFYKGATRIANCRSQPFSDF